MVFRKTCLKSAGYSEFYDVLNLNTYVIIIITIVNVHIRILFLKEIGSGEGAT